MESDTTQAIIIDAGGDTIKAGFHRDNYPHTIFPNLVGRFIHKGFGLREYCAGNEALEKENLLIIKSPFENGLVTDWDDMEYVWHHTFYDNLRVAPEEHPLLLTERPICPKSSNEKTTQIMFETFNTPALYLCSSALLSLYGAGRVTGTVVETGHTSSFSVPILHGHALPHAITRLEISGSQLTRYLTKSLSERSNSLFDTRSGLDRVRHFKETLSRVLLNYEHDMETRLSTEALKSSYKLPDGKEIRFGSELFTCPETLFRPNLCSNYGDSSRPPSLSLHESVHSSVSRCDNSAHKHLYENIVLSGGTSLLPGLRERLEREVSLLSPNNKVRVIAPAERKYLAWIGGANLASLNTFNSMWISKEEYDESGPFLPIRKDF